MRLPYGKDDASATSLWLDPLHAARLGFMVVVQDTRGRFASAGLWQPLRFERRDGYDSVQWAARLPGSNGLVGMYGCSYSGYTQWAAAIERPPALAAIAPGLTWSDPLDGLFARGGAVELGLVLPWTLRMGIDHVVRLGLPADQQAKRIGAILDDLDGLPTNGYWELPVSDMAVFRRHDLPELGTIRTLRDGHPPAYSRITGNYHNLATPSLHIAGWYDVCLQGTIDNHVAMAALGRTSRLVIGPWPHSDALADPVGQLCFGMRSNAEGMPEGSLRNVQLEWFRRHLQAPNVGEADQGQPVRIFVMGRNQWRDETDWPPSRTVLQKWYLGCEGNLHRSPPVSDALPAEFSYDPTNPVPTLGGHTVMEPAFQAGALDQADVEAREDVCVYTCRALDAELEVSGRIRVVLHVESSASSTDWVARLCDVYPSGRSFNVADGITRVCGVAGRPSRVEIDLWSTSIVFLAGHRIRVHVTSSSFPRWDRNLNTGDQDSPRSEVARQRIHHDAQRPSWIELPTRLEP
jgi:hypothetical protein